ncbi:unnamed protein product [Pocillopora meandrina]|uniref:Uncharacterized protein n=1 Tax=Pocillopora meandrina TaxID=46732 RepID=A0AAU9Y264_9CNID|nr:unnamed protein product [Pocillopora meandrina]
MKNSVWTIYHHMIKDDSCTLEEQHKLCPKGEGSWCKFWKALKEYKEDNRLFLIYLNLNYPELLKKCLEVKLNLNDSELDAIEADTRKQSKGNLFYRHRAGCIGASVSWSVTHSNPTQFLIKSLCYPHLFKVTSKAVTHGKKHEASAVEAYVFYI